MKKIKKFDALKMKQEIQDKINKEFAGLSDEEKNKVILLRASQDPLLNKFVPKSYSAT
jgi:hypothetical protein